MELFDLCATTTLLFPSKALKTRKQTMSDPVGMVLLDRFSDLPSIEQTGVNLQKVARVKEFLLTYKRVIVAKELLAAMIDEICPFQSRTHTPNCSGRGRQTNTFSSSRQRRYSRTA